MCDYANNVGLPSFKVYDELGNQLKQYSAIIGFDDEAELEMHLFNILEECGLKATMHYFKSELNKPYLILLSEVPDLSAATKGDDYTWSIGTTLIAAGILIPKVE
jgi:hypothetical protein